MSSERASKGITQTLHRVASKGESTKVADVSSHAAVHVFTRACYYRCVGCDKHDILAAVGLGRAAWAITASITEGYKKVLSREEGENPHLHAWSARVCLEDFACNIVQQYFFLQQ
jgi:hypothetical protein